AALSRGDALVLGAALALAAWRPLAAVGVAAAVAASSLRWGTTSLEALAGGQEVLGPAGWVGPTSAAAASWLAAAAVLLAAGRPLAGVGGVERRIAVPGAPSVADGVVGVAVLA